MSPGGGGGGGGGTEGERGRKRGREGEGERGRVPIFNDYIFGDREREKMDAYCKLLSKVLL